MAVTVAWASGLAARLLDPESDRWRHVESVADAAEEASALVPPADADLLVAAAWLHDIGYSSGVVDTGLHQLDGGRYLRRIGTDDRLSRLVANHSGAGYEARERGLARTLASEFPLERSSVADVLLYADMTVGPQGNRVDVAERVAEILRRYGPDDPVHRAITRAAPEIIATARDVGGRLSVLADQPR